MVQPHLRPAVHGLVTGALGASVLLADSMIRMTSVHVGSMGVRPLFALGVALFMFAIVLALQRAPAQVEAAAPPMMPAHVAFMQRQQQTAPVYVPTRRTAARAPASHLAPGSEHARLNAEIGRLTTQINKAAVMRATGRLSDEGYQRYVLELKRERADLESRRVTIELNQAPRRFD